MSFQTSIHPRPTEPPPTGYLNPGDGRPPFAVLHIDGPDCWVSLGSLTDDQAVAWLDTLADACTDLAARIRVRQQQTAALLAAVEASPGTAAGQ